MELMGSPVSPLCGVSTFSWTARLRRWALVLQSLHYPVLPGWSERERNDLSHETPVKGDTNTT